MRVVILSTILATVVALTVLFAYLVSKYIRERPQPPSMIQAYAAYEKQRTETMRDERLMDEILSQTIEQRRKMQEEQFRKWKENNQ